MQDIYFLGRIRKLEKQVFQYGLDFLKKYSSFPFPGRVYYFPYLIYPFIPLIHRFPKESPKKISHREIHLITQPAGWTKLGGNTPRRFTQRGNRPQDAKNPNPKERESKIHLNHAKHQIIEREPLIRIPIRPTGTGLFHRPNYSIPKIQSKTSYAHFPSERAGVVKLPGIGSSTIQASGLTES